MFTLRCLLLLFSFGVLTPTTYSQPVNRLPGSPSRQLYRVSRDDLSGISRVGFIDKTGKLVIAFDRLPETISGVSDFHDGLARVWIQRGGGSQTTPFLTGYIDETGTIVIAPQFRVARDFSDGLAYIETTEFRGFIDRVGKVVFKVDDPVVKDFHEGLAAVGTSEIGGKWGFIDRSGRVVVNRQYSFVDDFSEGLAGVIVDQKVGFINREGTMVIPPRFEPRMGRYLWNGIEATGRFSEGLARVKVGESYGFIDTKGDFQIQPKFHGAQDFSEGVAWVITSDKQIGWIDKSGRWSITVVNGQSISRAQSGLAYSGGITNSPMKFSEGLAPFSVIVNPGSYSRWGYMDHKGREIIKPKFAYVYPFEGGLAWVTNDEAYGFIDRKGQFIWRK